MSKKITPKDLHRAHRGGKLWFSVISGVGGRFCQLRFDLSDEDDTRRPACYIGDPNWDNPHTFDWVISDYGDPNQFVGMTGFQIKGLLACREK